MAGEFHNLYLNQVMVDLEANKSKLNSFKERTEFTISHAKSNFTGEDIDMTVVNYLINIQDKTGSAENFDPIVFLKSQKNYNINAKTITKHDLIVDFFEEVKMESGNIEKVKEICDKYGIISKNTLTNNDDKIIFENLMKFYYSSYSFWQNYYEINNLNISKNYSRVDDEPCGPEDCEVGENNYWKVAAADVVGGVAGGIWNFGLGAVVGWTSTSAVMAIGQCSCD